MQHWDISSSAFDGCPENCGVSPSLATCPTNSVQAFESLAVVLLAVVLLIVLLTTVQAVSVFYASDEYGLLIALFGDITTTLDHTVDWLVDSFK